MINHTIVKNLIIPACKIIGVVQLLSHIWLFAHVLQHTRLPCPSVSQTLLKFMPIESMMPFNHLTLCHPLLLFPSFFPSTRVFSNESALHIKWPKHWNFSISHSNEYSGLISFRIDWFELLAVRGTLKSRLQHHNSKALILQFQPSLWSNSQIRTWLMGVTTMTSYDKPKQHTKKQRHHFANQGA